MKRTKCHKKHKTLVANFKSVVLDSLATHVVNILSEMPHIIYTLLLHY